MAKMKPQRSYARRSSFWWSVRCEMSSPLQQNLLLVDPADGGYHGLFRGVSPASTPGRFERSQCRRALTLVWCATTGTIVNVRPAGQFRVYVRRATLTDIPASLTAYPPNGELDDATEMRGSVLTFDIVQRECVDPASQTPDSDGAECVCRQGFFDADPQDGELVCDPCAVGTYRDNIQDPTCLSCPGTSTTVGTASIAREDCVCNVGCVLGDLFPDPVGVLHRVSNRAGSQPLTWLLRAAPSIRMRWGSALPASRAPTTTRRTPARASRAPRGRTPWWVQNRWTSARCARR